MTVLAKLSSVLGKITLCNERILNSVDYSLWQRATLVNETNLHQQEVVSKI